MRTVEIVPFEIEHAEQIHADSVESEVEIKNGKYWQMTADYTGPAYTAICEGKIIAVGGINKFWDGVGEAWAIYPQGIEQNLKEVLYYTKKMLSKIIEEHGFWRIQATCRIDFPAAANWAEHLGFEIEGISKSFAPDGTDCYMYALTR